MTDATLPTFYTIYEGWQIARGNGRDVIVRGDGKRFVSEFGQMDHRFFEGMLKLLEAGKSTTINEGKPALNEYPPGLVDCILSSATLLEQNKDLMHQPEGSMLRCYATVLQGQVKNTVEPTWVTKLRDAAMRGAMKDVFWMSRDEVLYFTGQWGGWGKNAVGVVANATFIHTGAAPTQPNPYKSFLISCGIPANKFDHDQPWIFTGYSDAPDPKW